MERWWTCSSHPLCPLLALSGHAGRWTAAAAFGGKSDTSAAPIHSVLGPHKLALARKRAAFDAATLQFPDLRLALRKGIMVLREHVPPSK